MISYTVTVKKADGNDMDCDDCFSLVGQTSEFSILIEDDLSHSGSEYLVYMVVITGTAGILNPQSEPASFRLRVYNPCIDPAFVSIVLPTLTAQSYALYSDSPTGLSWVHDPFTLQFTSS